MNNKLVLSLALLLAASSANAFLSPQVVAGNPSTILFSAAESEQDEKPAQNEGLLLDARAVQEQMSKLKNKYPTAEADYLAAARKRAEMKVASQNDGSTDDDWKRAAQEKSKQSSGGADDDWEASLKEAGNQDSQIFIPMDVSASGDGEGEGGEEPKLLL